GRPLPAWVPEDYVDELRGRFPYVFDPSALPPEGTTRPELRVRTVRSEEPAEVLGSRLVPLRVPHGTVAVYGFRVGPLGYVTDAKRLPPRAMEDLRGVEVLVLNALW